MEFLTQKAERGQAEGSGANLGSKPMPDTSPAGCWLQLWHEDDLATQARKRMPHNAKL
jgi:hypothetical protein